MTLYIQKTTRLVIIVLAWHKEIGIEILAQHKLGRTCVSTVTSPTSALIFRLPSALMWLSSPFI